MKTINERLASELLIKRELTCYRIAKDIGYTSQSVDSWLKGIKGKYTMPNAEAVAKLCLKYSLDVNYVMFGKARLRR